MQLEGYKTISIRNLLEKRAEYPLSKDGDSWLDVVLADEIKDDVWLITVSSRSLNMLRRNSREQIIEKYYVVTSYKEAS